MAAQLDDVLAGVGPRPWEVRGHDAVDMTPALGGVRDPPQAGAARREGHAGAQHRAGDGPGSAAAEPDDPDATRAGGRCEGHDGVVGGEHRNRRKLRRPRRAPSRTRR